MLPEINQANPDLPLITQQFITSAAKTFRNPAAPVRKLRIEN